MFLNQSGKVNISLCCYMYEHAVYLKYMCNSLNLRIESLAELLHVFQRRDRIVLPIGVGRHGAGIVAESFKPEFLLESNCVKVVAS